MNGLKKRRFCRAVLLSGLLFCCLGGAASCGIAEKDYLFYQEGALTVCGVYEKNGISYEVEIVKEADGSGEVFYRSPDSVEGLGFRCDGEGVTLLHDGLTLSLGKIDHDAARLLSFFSLEKEKMEALSAEGDGIRLSFGDTVIWLNAETELPKAMESRAGGVPLKLTVESIEKGKSPRS